MKAKPKTLFIGDVLSRLDSIEQRLKRIEKLLKGGMLPDEVEKLGIQLDDLNKVAGRKA